MTFKAITFSLVAAAALLAQPAFAQGLPKSKSLADVTIGGVGAPAVGFGLVAVTTLASSKKDTSTATSTATATN